MTCSSKEEILEDAAASCWPKSFVALGMGTEVGVGVGVTNGGLGTKVIDTGTVEKVVMPGTPVTVS